MADTAPGGRITPRRRRVLVQGGAGLIVLALVGLVTWFVVHVDPRRAEVGQLVTGSTTDTYAGQQVTLLEPWGQVDVTVARARRSLPDDIVYDVGNLRAPAGGRFVNVRWQTTISSQPQTVQVPPFPRTRLSLVVGGRSLPLDSPEVAADPCDQANCVGKDGDDSVWVAVPGDASHLGVAAEFDGETQSVDVASHVRHAGVAARLYASSAGATLSPSCGTPRLSSGYRFSDELEAMDPDLCQLSAYRSSYAPGRGWARSGRDWVVVVASIGRPHGIVSGARGERATRYTAALLPMSVTAAHLSGAASGGPLSANTSDLTAVTGPNGTSVCVFSVPSSLPTGTLTLSSAASLVPDPVGDRGVAARGATVTLTWTVSS